MNVKKTGQKTCLADGLQASHCYQEFIHQLKMTRRRREQQYVDDNLFNHKSRTAMMVKWQVGADYRSQRLSSLLHSGRTRTPVLMSGTVVPLYVRLKLKK